MRAGSRTGDESGIALIAALLVVTLISGLTAGMFAALTADQRSNSVDRDQSQAYAAAHAGLEKLTSSLAQLFVTDVSPSVAQIYALATTPPSLPGFQFTAPGGSPGSGYAVSFTPDGAGLPLPIPNADITTGPFTGFKGIITPYNVTVTAVSGRGGAEVRLRRELQTVAVPVFQFGVFSESDVTFYAGDNFGFGGRVHTNGNLFVCEFAGTMTFSDRITAVKEVVHNYFSNGLAATSNSCTGPVNILTAPTTYRNLRQAPNEGSVTGMPGSAANTSWTNISVGIYKNYIRNGLTGAKKLDLPLVSQGAAPIDLIRRPATGSNENTVNPLVYGQRYYSQASLRILLSDRETDLTALPAVTATAPVLLDGNWNAAPPVGYTVDATHPPIARSIGPGSTLTVSGSTYGSLLAQIRVTDTGAGIPAVLKLPPLTVGVQPNIVCTGKTASSFTGCNLPAAALPADIVSALLPSGNSVLTLVTAAVLPGPSVTIPVTVNSAIPFSPTLVWMPTPSGATVPVTCTGYSDVSPRQLNNCSGLPAAPPSGLIVSTHALADAGTGLIGGYIKIEKQNAVGVWSDVTMEILNLGIAGTNLQGAACADPHPDAILRIQRLRDNGGAPSTCTYGTSQNATDYWANALFDTREANYRQVATTAAMQMGGVMQYIALDVNNLKKWFAGVTGTTGLTAVSTNGYIVYFSDRRGDHDENVAGDPETAQYGFEDNVNPASATGTPNATLDGGEDFDNDTLLDVYGQTPHPLAVPAGAADPYSLNGRPWSTISVANAPQARINKVVLFRRALKLVNGGIVGVVNSLPIAGLTVASENPVYVQGNYNAISTSANAEPNVPASILADAVTLLSTGWNDTTSFRFPNDRAQRVAATTGYRFAVAAGKGLSFPHPGAPGGSPQFLFGTDGGVGNFLRLLENWNTGSVAVNYRGSVVSLFHSRQAVGTFKYSSNVYDFAIRNFTFDTDFLQPALLPPGTPMFRDVNTLKFRQILRPNQ